MPFATIPTTAATGMRRPRMHGTPSICLGLTVMRVNFMALSSKDSASLGIAFYLDGRLGLPRTHPAIPEPGTASGKGAGGKRRCFTGLDRRFDILLISSIGPWLRTMTAKRPSTQRKPAVILLRYLFQDTAYGAYRKTTARIARTLGLSETQVVHVALANLARHTLPRYEPDDGPLTPEQLAAIDKLVPQGRFKPSKRPFLCGGFGSFLA